MSVYCARNYNNLRKFIIILFGHRETRVCSDADLPPGAYSSDCRLKYDSLDLADNRQYIRYRCRRHAAWGRSSWLGSVRVSRPILSQDWGTPYAPPVPATPGLDPTRIRHRWKHHTIRCRFVNRMSNSNLNEL